MPQHPYFLLRCPENRGALLLTPCPGTRETNLEQAIENLKAAGATAIVTLMPDAEMIENGVGDLPPQTKARGMAWYHLPVEDEGAPTEAFAAAWQQAGPAIHSHLDNHEAVAIHCKGGAGRTGIVAAQILMERGLSMPQTVAQVKAVRPTAFSHDVQVKYIEQLATRLGT